MKIHLKLIIPCRFNILKLKQKDLKDEVKQEASEILFNLTGINDEQFDFVNTNIKKFQVFNSIYKIFYIN